MPNFRTEGFAEDWIQPNLRPSGFQNAIFEQISSGILTSGRYLSGYGLDGTRKTNVAPNIGWMTYIRRRFVRILEKKLPSGGYLFGYRKYCSWKDDICPDIVRMTCVWRIFCPLVEMQPVMIAMVGNVCDKNYSNRHKKPSPIVRTPYPCIGAGLRCLGSGAQIVSLCGSWNLCPPDWGDGVRGFLEINFGNQYGGRNVAPPGSS